MVKRKVYIYWLPMENEQENETIENPAYFIKWQKNAETLLCIMKEFSHPKTLTA